MKRLRQKYGNQKTIDMLKTIILISSPRTPSYEKATAQLNTLGYSTSRGNPWTPQRLLRMLQRNGISGLHGLKITSANNPRNPHENQGIRIPTEKIWSKR